MTKRGLVSESVGGQESMFSRVIVRGILFAVRRRVSKRMTDNLGILDVRETRYVGLICEAWPIEISAALFSDRESR